MGRGGSARIATALGAAALLAGTCAIVHAREASAADAGRSGVDIPTMDGGTDADSTAEAMADGRDADRADAAGRQDAEGDGPLDGAAAAGNADTDAAAGGTTGKTKTKTAAQAFQSFDQFLDAGLWLICLLAITADVLLWRKFRHSRLNWIVAQGRMKDADSHYVQASAQALASAAYKGAAKAAGAELDHRERELLTFCVERRQRTALLIIAVLLQVTGVIVVLESGLRWEILVALLPFLIVTYHAQYLWVDAPLPTPNAMSSGDATIKRVNDRLESYYHWEAIALRYVVPAVMLALAGFAALRVAEHTPELIQPYLSNYAFAYGLFGAYSFVYLELGRRSVRNDITPVSVLWALTTLVVGPPLAAVLPHVFSTSTATSTADVGGLWNEKAVWIFAGYAPKFVFGKLVAGVMKALHADTSSIQEDRQIPLGRVSGIGADEAERLAEEGIKNVHSLACVEPLRLMRDTRFDNWQIATWVDQALLISAVPEAVWRALIHRGYQGATDALWFLSRARPDKDDKDKKERDEKISPAVAAPPPQTAPQPPESVPGAAAPPPKTSSVTDPASPPASESDIMVAVATEARFEPIEVELMLRRLKTDPRVADLDVLLSILSRSNGRASSENGDSTSPPPLPSPTPTSTTP